MSNSSGIFVPAAKVWVYTGLFVVSYRRETVSRLIKQALVARNADRRLLNG